VKNSLEPKIVKTKLDLKQKVWKQATCEWLNEQSKEKQTDNIHFIFSIYI